MPNISECNKSNNSHVCFGQRHWNYNTTKVFNTATTTIATNNKIRYEEVLLLTLSNLFFIFPVLFALYKRLYIESLLFFFTMLFSILYHSCDQKYYCIFKYNELQLADFISSYSSFIITILSMSKLERYWKAFTYFFALLLSLAANLYNRFNKIILIVMIAISFSFTLVTWSIIWYRERKLFPSKLSLLLYIPGLILSIAGVVIYNLFKINKHYWILHSIWHLLMALSILFFLPDCDRKPLFSINIFKNKKNHSISLTNKAEQAESSVLVVGNDEKNVLSNLEPI